MESGAILLLLLRRFSHVRLCATPQMAAHQAPLSLAFSRQEHWSGLPFPSPVHESEVTQSCLTLRDPMDCSLQGSPAQGIFQARALEVGCHFFLQCMKVKSESEVAQSCPTYYKAFILQILRAIESFRQTWDTVTAKPLGSAVPKPNHSFIELGNSLSSTCPF